MKIESIHLIRNRGTVYSVTVDVDTRREGTRVRRMRDDMTWHIRGFERFAMVADAPILTAGERVGLLLDECDLAVGDDVEFMNVWEVLQSTMIPMYRCDVRINGESVDFTHLRYQRDRALP